MQNLTFGCKQHWLCLVRVCFLMLHFEKRFAGTWLENKGYAIGHLDVCIL